MSRKSKRDYSTIKIPCEFLNGTLRAHLVKIKDKEILLSESEKEFRSLYLGMEFTLPSNPRYSLRKFANRVVKITDARIYNGEFYIWITPKRIKTGNDGDNSEYLDSSDITRESIPINKALEWIRRGQEYDQ